MSPLWWFCCSIALLSNFNVFVASQCPGWYDNSAAAYPGVPPSPYPIVVKSGQKNTWKHMLPLILLMLTDNGFGYPPPGYSPNPGSCCGNGCCCNCNNDSPMLIPFPIPIGVNSPIIV